MKLIHSEMLSCFPKDSPISWLGQARKYFRETQIRIDNKGDLYCVIYEDSNLCDGLSRGELLYYGIEDYRADEKDWQHKKRKRFLVKRSSKICSSNSGGSIKSTGR